MAGPPRFRTRERITDWISLTHTPTKSLPRQLGHRACVRLRGIAATIPEPTEQSRNRRGCAEPVDGALDRMALHVGLCTEACGRPPAEPRRCCRHPLGQVGRALHGHRPDRRPQKSSGRGRLVVTVVILMCSQAGLDVAAAPSRAGASAGDRPEGFRPAPARVRRSRDPSVGYVAYEHAATGLLASAEMGLLLGARRVGAVRLGTWAWRRPSGRTEPSWSRG
jgi:hypothetical protein